jgi:hypothetical protein
VPSVLRTRHLRGPPIDDRTHITRSIEDAARSLGEPVDVEQAMREVVDVARDSVPDFDHASVTLLLPGGRFETTAATGPLPRELDAAQYAAGEGPCLDAVRHGELTSVPHLRSERRWPSYVPAAVALGVRSHLSVSLRVGGEGTSAGLNLYSTTADEISLESKAMALLFGFHSIDGPGRATTPSRSGPAADALRVIGDALGIVMDRDGLDALRAFDHLDAAAARADLPLPTYARRLVDEARGS